MQSYFSTLSNTMFGVAFLTGKISTKGKTAEQLKQEKDVSFFSEII